MRIHPLRISSITLSPMAMTRQQQVLHTNHSCLTAWRKHRKTACQAIHKPHRMQVRGIHLHGSNSMPLQLPLSPCSSSTWPQWLLTVLKGQAFHKHLHSNSNLINFQDINYHKDHHRVDVVGVEEDHGGIERTNNCSIFVIHCGI